MVSISVTVTVPDRILRDEDIRGEIERTLKHQTGPQVKELFEKTVEGWEDQPTFSSKFTSRSDALSVTIFTTHKTYALVNAGAPPHPITPRRGGMLRFQPEYSAATKPRVIGSRAARRSGSVVGAFSVRHPGFEAREFDQTIAEEIAPDFAKDIQDAITRAASR